jgi:cytochrome c oxidase subunit 2
MAYLSGSGAKAYPVVGLTWGLLLISITVTVIVALLVVAGVLTRRSRSVFGEIGETPVAQPAAMHWITWGVGISSIALVVSLIWTVAVLAQINEPPSSEPFTIQVTGHQWWWEVAYLSPDSSRVLRTANEILIPVGRPVRFRLKGADVIHSFWVPALGGKTDTIPGQTNVTWLEADRPGRYRGQCTEYCGLEHAKMAFEVVADSPTRFRAWWDHQLADAAPATAADTSAGEALFVEKCGACHTVRGAVAEGANAGGQVAPDLTHLMSRRWIAAGAAPNTPAGLTAWIANPQSIKPGTLMPTLYLSGPQLTQLRAYLETLR